VHDEGDCSTCFAFAAAEAYYSGQVFAGYQPESYISVQQILDCIEPEKDQPKHQMTRYHCSRGSMAFDALTHLQKYVPTSETNYAYKNGPVQENGIKPECKIHYVKRSANDKKFYNVHKLNYCDVGQYYGHKYHPDRFPSSWKMIDERIMATALWHFGPLLVTVDARALQSFDRGNQKIPHIISASHCAEYMQNEINKAVRDIKQRRSNEIPPYKQIFERHEVLLVGLKQDEKTGIWYWILKVSFNNSLE